MQPASTASDCRQRTGWYSCVSLRRSTGSSSSWPSLLAYCPGESPLNRSNRFRTSIHFHIVHRFMYRIIETTMWPDDMTREMIRAKIEKQGGDDLLVTWSRSTSASSIYRWVFCTTHQWTRCFEFHAYSRLLNWRPKNWMREFLFAEMSNTDRNNKLSLQLAELKCFKDGPVFFVVKKSTSTRITNIIEFFFDQSTTSRNKPIFMGKNKNFF